MYKYSVEIDGDVYSLEFKKDSACLSINSSQARIPINVFANMARFYWNNKKDIEFESKLAEVVKSTSSGVLVCMNETASN